MIKCVCIGGPQDGFEFELSKNLKSVRFPRLTMLGFTEVEYVKTRMNKDGVWEFELK